MILVCICWLTKSILFFYTNHIASACVSLISLGFSIASVWIAIVIYKKQEKGSHYLEKRKEKSHAIENGTKFIYEVQIESNKFIDWLIKYTGSYLDNHGNCNRLNIEKLYNAVLSRHNLFKSKSSEEQNYIRHNRFMQLILETLTLVLHIELKNIHNYIYHDRKFGKEKQRRFIRALIDMGWKGDWHYNSKNKKP